MSDLIGLQQMANTNAPAEPNSGKASRSRPRRRLKPEQRRAEILEATMTLLAEKGYRGLTLADVAKHLDITVQAVLHYFPSKEALLLDVLDWRDQVDIHTVSPSDRHVRTAAEYVEAVDRLVQRNARRPEIIRLYTVLSAESLDPVHPAHDFFNDRLQRAIATLAERAEAWHPEPEQLALQTISVLDGLQLHWLRDPTIDLVQQWRTWAAGTLGQTATHTTAATPPVVHP
ncbi:TetR/AcrR family transcriptional regulator [Nonomuraea sp. NPDC049480]|uniref:TetR/AcrR family transcriptional regulator n=1 Tax=Nonomuraea sp. NPDC049480 TaxID=3364353 RepID=UPI0037937439